MSGELGAQQAGHARRRRRAGAPRARRAPRRASRRAGRPAPPSTPPIEYGWHGGPPATTSTPANSRKSATSRRRAHARPAVGAKRRDALAVALEQRRRAGSRRVRVRAPCRRSRRTARAPWGGRRRLRALALALGAHNKAVHGARGKCKVADLTVSFLGADVRPRSVQTALLAASASFSCPKQTPNTQPSPIKPLFKCSRHFFASHPPHTTRVLCSSDCFPPVARSRSKAAELESAVLAFGAGRLVAPATPLRAARAFCLV